MKKIVYALIFCASLNGFIFGCFCGSSKSKVIPFKWLNKNGAGKNVISVTNQDVSRVKKKKYQIAGATGVWLVDTTLTDKQVKKINKFIISGASSTAHPNQVED